MSGRRPQRRLRADEGACAAHNEPVSPVAGLGALLR